MAILKNGSSVEGNLTVTGTLKVKTVEAVNITGNTKVNGTTDSAQKLMWGPDGNLTDEAGSPTQPVYFYEGIPKATKYTLDLAYTTSDGIVIPGLVKSGGDVTISNGEITVIDDSHNHVISNVDGLQTALNGKAASNHTHTTIANDLILKKNRTYCEMTAGTFNAMSDMRLKENFQPLNLEKSILDLPTYKFDFIDGAKNQIGCKAQDLQEICPEIVSEGTDGMLSIKESKIVYLLLEEVKKLRKELDELRGR